jgi:hypothetical protein
MSASWWLAVYGYQRLTSETLIAELRFSKQQKGAYLASLYLPQKCEQAHYLLYGDQWRIDVQFQKPRYWANLIGLDSLYRLDRLQGRYQSVDAENRRRQHAYDLRQKNTAVSTMQDVTQKLFGFMYDTNYGSSNYAEIDPDIRYLIYKTPTGLLTRRKEISDARIDRQGLTITIDKACGKQKPGWFADLF